MPSLTHTSSALAAPSFDESFRSAEPWSYSEAMNR
jgi:hypothetical protein